MISGELFPVFLRHIEQDDKEVEVKWKPPILLVLVVAGATLSACAGSGTGVLQGQVLVFSPVVSPGKPPDLRPTASFTTTVEAKMHGRLVASQRVLPGGVFRIALNPGSYVVGISQEVVPGNCDAPVTIHSHHTTDMDVRCSLP